MAEGVAILGQIDNDEDMLNDEDEGDKERGEKIASKECLEALDRVRLKEIFAQLCAEPQVVVNEL